MKIHTISPPSRRGVDLSLKLWTILSRDYWTSSGTSEPNLSNRKPCNMTSLMGVYLSLKTICRDITGPHPHQNPGFAHENPHNIVSLKTGASLSRFENMHVLRRKCAPLCDLRSIYETEVRFATHFRAFCTYKLKYFRRCALRRTSVRSAQYLQILVRLGCARGLGARVP
jgi:hypothetical protein